MTDARIHESILNNEKIDALSDGAVRVWLFGLSLSASQGTDGRIPDRALRRLHPDGRRLDLVEELVDARCWHPPGHGCAGKHCYPIRTGWLIHDWAQYQTSAANVEKAREADRVRKAASRQWKADSQQLHDAASNGARTTGRHA